MGIFSATARSMFRPSDRTVARRQVYMENLRAQERARLRAKANRPPVHFDGGLIGQWIIKKLNNR